MHDVKISQNSLEDKTYRECEYIENTIRDDSALTLFFLMDNPIHTDTISMDLSSLYSKGLAGQKFYKMVYFCP